MPAFHPLLLAQSPKPTFPTVGPSSHPPAAIASVDTPSKIKGSIPEICAAHVSKSCSASTGPNTTAVVKAVAILQPKLIQRLFRRRSKKRFHVRMWSGTFCCDDEGGGIPDVLALRTKTARGSCEIREVLCGRVCCFNGFAAVVKAAQTVEGALCRGAARVRRHVARGVRKVAMVCGMDVVDEEDSGS